MNQSQKALAVNRNKVRLPQMAVDTKEFMPDRFLTHRKRLFGIAYRMLGTRVDAEDILQDVYLRWHDADVSGLDSDEAWLVTVTTRLCIDRLRAAKVEREAYIGPWLPEPLTEAVDIETPEHAVERASDLSIAFLTLLERLGPEERAAFVLHDVFDTDYSDIAATLDKQEAACRQLVARARKRLQEDRPRFNVSRDAHLSLLGRFVAATRTGDIAAIKALFNEEAWLVADGGGKVVSVLNILRGATRIADLFQVVMRREGDHIRYDIAEINGEPSLLRYLDGQLDTVYAFVTDGATIHQVYSLRNPDKLAALAADIATRA